MLLSQDFFGLGLEVLERRGVTHLFGVSFPLWWNMVCFPLCKRNIGYGGILYV